MPGNPLSITLPTVGVTVGPTYATSINSALQTIIDDVEAKITPDEITVNDDLDFTSAGTAYKPINAAGIQMTQESGTLTGGNQDTVYAYNDELYFQDGNGNNIPITSSGAVAGAAGNITTTGSPAYASSNVELLWNGGNLDYSFKSGSGNTYADIIFHEADFRNGANTMKLTSNVTSDYAINFPAGGPSAGEVIELDGSGNVSFVSSLTSSLNFAAGATCTSGQDFTVSGTGRYVHGDIPYLFSALSGGGGAGTSYGNGYATIGAGGEWYVPIDIPRGVEITQFELFYRHSLTANITVEFGYFEAGSRVAIDDTSTESATSTVWGSRQVTGLTTTTSGNRSYYFRIANISGTTDISTIKMVWNQP